MAYLGKVGQEEVVEEVDVQGALADKLEGRTDPGAGGEAVLIGLEGVVDDEQTKVADEHLEEDVGHLPTIHAAAYVAADVAGLGVEQAGKQEDDGGGEVLVVEQSAEIVLVHRTDVSESEILEVVERMVQAEYIAYLIQCGVQLEGYLGQEQTSRQQDEGNEHALAVGLSVGVVEAGVGRVYEEENLEQGDGEPVAELAVVGDEGVEIGSKVGVGIEEAEDEGGDELYQQFLPAHAPPGVAVPFDAGLVCDEAADEEEEGHAERHEEAVDEGGGGEPETGHFDVGEYDQDHGHAAQGVDVFNSFGRLCCGCCHRCVMSVDG